MSATHIHLVLNHVPVLGTFFGLAILVFGLFRKSEDIKKLALGIVAVCALFTVPVYLTGESAADQVEDLPGVSHALVEQHEEAAAVAFTAIVILGLASFVGLVWRRNRTLPGWFVSIVLIGLVALGGLMAWTANLGGQVRHTEIRSGASPEAGENNNGSDR